MKKKKKLKNPLTEKSLQFLRLFISIYIPTQILHFRFKIKELHQFNDV